MRLTVAVKNLLIINVLCYAALFVVQRSFAFDLNDLLGLHYAQAPAFGPWQLLTFMFMHGSLTHLFCNMFALWMFGPLIEEGLGTKRFLLYYLVCGVGSGLIQQFAVHFDVAPLTTAVDQLLSNLNPDAVQLFMANHVRAVSNESYALINDFIKSYNELIHTDPGAALDRARQFAVAYQDAYLDAHVTVGASGAVFGLLLAVGLMYPNMQVMLLFPPIPMKAKWFVLAYGLLELVAGIHGSQLDNVAHWAHLGGMLFGFILLRQWRCIRL